MSVDRCRDAKGYDAILANTNAGYGYVFAWAGLIESELKICKLSGKERSDYFKNKIIFLYNWISDKDYIVQDGASLALNTLETSNWKYAQDVIYSEAAVIDDLNTMYSEDSVYG